MSRETLRHGASCNCAQCRDEREVERQSITTAPPMRGLPDSQVSVGELLGNSRVAYRIGEDWNDD